MSRYVIWGTGRQARITLNMYMPGYFDRNNTIEYFVDNNSDKWGKLFFLQIQIVGIYADLQDCIKKILKK